jgi:hypothetical protein
LHNIHSRPAAGAASPHLSLLGLRGAGGRQLGDLDGALEVDPDGAEAHEVGLAYRPCQRIAPHVRRVQAGWLRCQLQRHPTEEGSQRQHRERVGATCRVVLTRVAWCVVAARRQ